ncbi:MAG TPA: hypothetical protein VJ488_03960 [Dehalococcoidia bacterium]|nr:hypothetical protein [Dehalococcoidia bacterium]
MQKNGKKKPVTLCFLQQRQRIGHIQPHCRHRQLLFGLLFLELQLMWNVIY